LTSPSDELKNRFLGCLLGCAVGDALGAPFEGLWSHSIPDEGALLAGFGEFEGYPPGQYTDDTQLSVATVQAILKARDVVPAEIARSIAWLWKTESVVGPGGACTRAAHSFLKSGDWSTCGAPVGQAGNGTAMRTAVVGLFFVNTPDALPAVVADVSRITHHDPRSVAGGVAVAKAAQLFLAGEAPSCESFCRRNCRFDRITGAGVRSDGSRTSTLAARRPGNSGS
jgi:ADP-ribosylglycohydrolase